MAVMVVNYGSHALVGRHLAPLDLDALGAIAVIVDSYSTEQERAAVRGLAADEGWQLLTPATNVGFGGGMNLAGDVALRAGCDVLVLLNPDVSVDDATLAALATHVREHPDTVVSPRLTRPDGSTWFDGGQLDLSTGIISSRSGGGDGKGPDAAGRWLTGACLVLHRTAWERLGGFDASYFLYWEDVDLSQRWLRRGGDLAVLGDLVAVHDVGATQRDADDTTERKSPVYVEHMCRNRLRFAGAHLPPSARLRWLLHTPRATARVLRRDGWRDVLRRPEMLLAALRGVLTGLPLLCRRATG